MLLFLIQACVQSVQHLSSGQYVSEDRLLTLCQLPDEACRQLYTQVQSLLSPMGNDPVVAQLSLEGSKFDKKLSLEELFIDADTANSAEVLLQGIIELLHEDIKPVFIINCTYIYRMSNPTFSCMPLCNCKLRLCAIQSLFYIPTGNCQTPSCCTQC